MDFAVWKVVLGGFLIWKYVGWCRNNGAKQNHEDIVNPGDGGDTLRDYPLESKHKIFLSHSGAQKSFVEQLCVDFERRDRYPFFDIRHHSLPIGKNFPKLIFEAIEQCEVGVVILSNEFFTQSKWPMLELVAMTKNPKLIIIPVYFGVSLKQIRDPKQQKEWTSIWHSWAKKAKKGRGIDIEEWCGALKSLGPINSLFYDGISEVSFRDKIATAVCDIVLPETKFEDSHMQGRSRMCKVVCEKIEQATISEKYGACVVGLYGVGGIGKTTMCQALCNEFSARMQGRVCHIGLGIASNLELLQELLKRLTDKNYECISKLNESECKDLLKREMPKHAIFLAIDNMSDGQKSLEQAKLILSGGFAVGSVVIVTSRSLDVLRIHHLGIDENNCLEMPELELNEAKSLFLKYAVLDNETRNEVDDEVLRTCVKRCYFKKGVERSFHYHPLALKVLALQLGCSKYDRVKWKEQLQEPDVFNGQREGSHPIFSILRKSFDNLQPEDKMLFMDVALFLPVQECGVSNWTSFEWLKMLHRTSLQDMMKRLKGLKRKSLLEDLGDGLSMRIGMHDLWREFAVMESKAGEFEGRRWVYEVGGSRVLEEAGVPAGGCWQNVKRMCFLDCSLMSVRRLNFDHFPNLIVLKLVGTASELFKESGFVLNVESLKHLKSLELTLNWSYQGIIVEVVGLRSVENLCFLKLSCIQVAATTVDDIGYLTSLQVLVLTRIPGERFPDLSKLISLEVVNFSDCDRVVTISGLSSRLSSLRILNLSGCTKLRSLGRCVGELLALQELNLRGCKNLDELPNLRMLTNLRILKIRLWRVKSLLGLGDLSNFPNLQELELFGCGSLMELTCSGPLDALRVLNLQDCRSLTKFQDPSNLSHLEELLMIGCESLAELTCTGSVSALKRAVLSGTCGLKAIPDLSKFANLRELELRGCGSLMELTCSEPLDALKLLTLDDCRSLTKFPDLSNLSHLEALYIRHCESLAELTCTGSVSALKRAVLSGCCGLKAIPDLSKFANLRELELCGCGSLMELTCSEPLDALKLLTLDDCRSLTKFPDLSNLSHLEALYIRHCESLAELTCTGSVSALKRAVLSGCSSLKAIPDLSYFPKLGKLDLSGCGSLMELTCSGPLDALKVLDLQDCWSLTKFPDLSNLSHLEALQITCCESLAELRCTGSVSALGCAVLSGYCGLKAIPDLSKFANLRELELCGCGSLMELTCSGPLDALKVLTLGECQSLTKFPDLGNLAHLEALRIERCESLAELTCTGSVSALKRAVLSGCCGLKAIPDLSKFANLRELELRGCGSLMELTCSEPLDALKLLTLDDCWSLTKFPDLSNLAHLKALWISGCESLAELTCTGSVSALGCAFLSGCSSLKAIPDLSNFPELELCGCGSLMELTCSGPLDALKVLTLGECQSLTKFPDLGNLAHLEALRIERCESLAELTCTGSVSALKRAVLSGCCGLKAIPDLSKFANLRELELCGCGSLMELTCSEPLDALKVLDFRDCRSLTKFPDLSNLSHLKALYIAHCVSLMHSHRAGILVGKRGPLVCYFG